MIDKTVIKQENLSFHDLVEITMQATGYDEAQAGFVVAMELGIIPPNGDVLTELDPDPEIQDELESLFSR